MNIAQVRLQFVNTTSSNITFIDLWGQSTECYKCVMLPLANLSIPSNYVSAYVNISTEWPWNLHLRIVHDVDKNFTNSTKLHFGEHGVYSMVVQEDFSFYYKEEELPTSTYLSPFFLFISLFLSFLSLSLFLFYLLSTLHQLFNELALCL